jgi:hypothetical protein
MKVYGEVAAFLTSAVSVAIVTLGVVGNNEARRMTATKKSSR